MNPLVFLIIGVAGLYIGAGYVVESAKNIAEKLNVSHALVGLTIISIGTSIPEIMTNFFAGLKVRLGIEASGIAVGTNIGSDITQITFILGFTALLGTMYATKKLLRRDFPMVLFSIVAVFIVGITGFRVGFFEGAILLAIYFVYLYYISEHESVMGKVKHKLNKIDKGRFLRNLLVRAFKRGYIYDAILMALGMAILVIVSDMVVESAIMLAEVWGVTQSFIGVMLVGVGTGLPELSTAIRAIFKKAGGISVGTLIGSNITDPMFSLPVGAMASGIGLTFDKNLLFFDIPFWFIASIIAFSMFVIKKRIGRSDKKQGMVLIGLYILFVFLKLKFFLH